MGHERGIVTAARSWFALLMSQDRQRWAQLAAQLDLTFSPGVRGMLESKIAGRIAAQRGQDPDQIASVMNNPLVMGVLERVFLGVVKGPYRDHEFFIYRNNRSQSSTASASYSVHVHLFFPESAEIGLSIYRERFWSKVGKLLGAQDIQSGNAELDPLVMIKAGVPQRAQHLLGNHSVQQTLLELFQDSENFEVDDNGIEHRTYGAEFLAAGELRPLMDRMVDAAEIIWPVLKDC